MSKQRDKKSGRPPQYVQFRGQTIVGLSGPKSPIDVDGRYYSTHNDSITGKREYFGRDLEEAIRLFRVWRSEQVQVPPPQEWRIAQATGSGEHEAS